MLVPVQVPVAVPVMLPPPEPVRVEVPVIQTVEKVVQPPPQPVPVMVKTIHDQTVIQEAPTDIHHVELVTKKAAPARSSAPV